MSLHTGFKTEVTVCDDAENLLSVNNRNAANLMLCAHGDNVANEHIGSHRNGVTDDTGFVALDASDFVSLCIWAHILMNDADAAFLGHGDSKCGFGNRIHSSR